MDKKIKLKFFLVLPPRGVNFTQPEICQCLDFDDAPFYFAKIDSFLVLNEIGQYELVNISFLADRKDILCYGGKHV